MALTDWKRKNDMIFFSMVQKTQANIMLKVKFESFTYWGREQA